MCTQVHLKPFPLYFQSQEETMGTSLLSQSTPQVIAPQPPRLLDQVVQAARRKREMDDIWSMIDLDALSSYIESILH